MKTLKTLKKKLTLPEDGKTSHLHEFDGDCEHGHPFKSNLLIAIPTKNAVQSPPKIPIQFSTEIEKAFFFGGGGWS